MCYELLWDMDMKIQIHLYLRVVVQAGSRLSRQDNGEYTVRSGQAAIIRIQKQSKVKNQKKNMENAHKCRHTVQQDFAVSECEHKLYNIYRQTNRMRHRWTQSVNEVQVNVISDDESGQWVLGNVVVSETWASGVECPLVTLKGTPTGDVTPSTQ